MNISPVSFGKLHIENNQDNKDFLTMVCANKTNAPAREFTAINWVSGNNDIFLKSKREDGYRIAYEVEMTDSNGSVIALETLRPSNSTAGLKNLGEQILKHYYDLENKEAPTPEQLLDLYS